MSAHHDINYVEFASSDLTASKLFFGKVFGWEFTDYGPDYTAFSAGSAGVDGGFHHNTPSDGALIVLYSTDLQATRAAVLEAGGKLTKDIFGFPGGERFEFREPGGNMLAVWSEQSDPKDA